MRITLGLLTFSFLAASKCVATVTAAPPWDPTTLSAPLTIDGVTRYLRDLRLLSQRSVDGATGSDILTRETLLAPKIDAALIPISTAYTEQLLAECVAAEKSIPIRSEPVYQDRNGALEFIGYDEVKPTARTLFTRRVLRWLMTATDFSSGSQKSLFKHLGEIPELILVLRTRPWDETAEPYLTTAIFRRLDDTGEWHGTQSGWIEYLIRVNSQGTWKVLQYLLVDASPQIKIEALAAVLAVQTAPLDMNAIIRKAWAAEQRSNGRPDLYAPTAARQGHAAALVYLAHRVLDEKTKPADSKLYGDIVLNSLEASFPSATAAAEQIFSKSRDLVFDATTRKYRFSGR